MEDPVIRIEMQISHDRRMAKVEFSSENGIEAVLIGNKNDLLQIGEQFKSAAMELEEPSCDCCDGESEDKEAQRLDKVAEEVFRDSQPSRKDLQTLLAVVSRMADKQARQMKKETYRD